MKHVATITAGKIKPLSMDQWLKDVAKKEGKEVTINLQIKYKKRTVPENKYFHGVVLARIADHLGYEGAEEIDMVKSYLKVKFGVKETSALTTVEFENFLAQVRRWASIELGLYIPLPNEPDDYEGIFLQ